MANSIECINCDAVVDLTGLTMPVDGLILRCPSCKSKLRAMPTGVVTLHSTSNPMSAGPSGSAAFGSGSSARPVAAAAYGADLPNLSILQSPGSAWAGRVATVEQLDFPRLVLGSVFRHKYRIDGEIGQGGSAVVYRAHDLDAEMDVALKVVGVVGEQADSLRRAWAQEYKLRRQVSDGSHLLSLESPQVEVVEGTTYVALPQELGQQTLRKWLDETRTDVRGRQAEGLRLFTEVCRGVEALHESNVAHLDLKPENVVLVVNERAGETDGNKLIAKVGDFGLARSEGSQRRREGTGTPLYNAPEQISCAHEKEIGPWSDIYSLGCLLFEILEGDPLFSGTSAELKRKHLETPPRKLRGVAEHLQSVVMSCLAKDRDERMASVESLRLGIEKNPEEDAAFAKAEQANSEAGWEAFLHGWGTGRHSAAAQGALSALVERREAKAEAKQRLAETAEAERLASVQLRLERERAEDQAFANAEEVDSEPVWREFVETWPNGRHDEAAQKALAECEFELAARPVLLRTGKSTDWPHTIKWLRRAAERGHVQAQYNLGRFCKDGDGVAKDATQAVAWFRRAADQGHSRSQFELGYLYSNGEGVAKDATQAVAWFGRAAEQGHATAQSNLGLMYRKGEGVAKDATQAVAWYRRAAEQGDANAQFLLGVMYGNGEGVAKDATQAVAWYRRAAEQGDANAQVKLGYQYAKGEGVAKDATQAVAWYRRAAEQGNASAQLILGIMYGRGEGVAKDAMQAVACYRRAAEQGHAVGQLLLGEQYAKGEGVAKDSTQALAWYRRAAEQGDAEAQFQLGEAFYQGNGVAKDSKQAVAWYRRAAKQGHAEAQNKLASVC